MLDALSSDKESLINKYSNLLLRNSNLLRFSEFDFWKTQLDNIDWNEIPVTVNGVKREVVLWNNFEPNLKEISIRLKETSENVLTYWQENDLCEMQGQFYYYKDKDSNQVFGESEYGKIRAKDISLVGMNIVIASITDIKESELIRNEIYDKLL